MIGPRAQSPSPPTLTEGESTLVGADGSGANDPGTILFPAAVETGPVQYTSRRMHLHHPNTKKKEKQKKGGKPSAYCD